MNPLVSVHIPTKNRPLSLAITLSGFLHQTFRDFEIIIVDDSVETYKNDSVKRIITILRNLGIKVHYESQGGGIPQAFELCRRKTTASFCVKHEDDMLVPSTYIEDLYQCISNAEDEVAAIGGLMISVDGAKVRARLPQGTDNFGNGFQHHYREGVGELWAPFDFSQIMYEFRDIEEAKKAKKLYWASHLHGVFIYKKDVIGGVGGFSTYLTPIGHREETDLTSKLTANDYVNLIAPWIISYHLESATGGSRTDWDVKLASQLPDEIEFQKRLKEYVKMNPGLM